VVSTQWNSLSPETRAVLIGAGKVTGVVLSPVGVGQIRNLVVSAPGAVSDGVRTMAVQNMIRNAGAVDLADAPWPHVRCCLAQCLLHVA
jgi:outer membrane lipoprotein SlyB